MFKHDIFNQKYTGFVAVCVQVLPEHQTSPFDWAEDFEDGFPGVIIHGNKEFKSMGTTEWFTTLFDRMYYGFGDIQDILEGNDGYYKTPEQYINDYFPKIYGDKKYSSEDILYITKTLQDLETAKRDEQEELILKLMFMMTGQVYNCTYIRGCVQSEWQEIYYPVEQYTAANIRYIEACYFNTGTEYMVYEVDMEGRIDEDEGYSDYCITYNIKEELAEHVGCKPQAIIVYNVDGVVHSHIYAEQK